MEFPTIFDLLDRLAPLRGEPAVVIALLAAAVAVVGGAIGLLRRPAPAQAAPVPFAPPAVPGLPLVYLAGGSLPVHGLHPPPATRPPPLAYAREVRRVARRAHRLARGATPGRPGTDSRARRGGAARPAADKRGPAAPGAQAGGGGGPVR